MLSIRVLEQDNEVCREELMRVKRELTGILKEKPTLKGEVECEIGKHGKSKEILRTLKESTKNCDVGKKLLVLSDQTGYGVGYKLRQYLPNYKIQSIIKPHALCGGVVSDVVGLCEQLGSDDCVVIMAGANDFTRGIYPSFKELNSRLKHITHTNVVLTSVSSGFSGRIGRFVRRYNKALEDYAARLDRYAAAKVSFLDLSSRNMSELCKGLVKGVSARKRAGNSNLIFVEAVDSGAGLCGRGLSSHGRRIAVASPTETLVSDTVSSAEPLDDRSCSSAGHAVGVLRMHDQQDGIPYNGSNLGGGVDLLLESGQPGGSTFLGTRALLTCTD